jgi:hypothetical protein
LPDEADSLESLAKQLSDLDKEREQYIEWLRGKSYEPGQRVIFTDGEGVAKQKRFVAVENELEVLRPRYMSRLLASLDASSKRLEETSKAQVGMTANLEKAERQLGAISAALLLLTGVLAVFVAGSYTLQVFANAGYSGLALDYWAFVIQIVVAELVSYGLWQVVLVFREGNADSVLHDAPFRTSEDLAQG